MGARRTRVFLGWGLLAAAISGAGAVALSSWRCRARGAGEPALEGVALSGPGLRAGAAKVAIQAALPVVVAGYGPPRSEAQSAEPLFARALVLDSAAGKIGLVAL